MAAGTSGNGFVMSAPPVGGRCYCLGLCLLLSLPLLLSAAKTDEQKLMDAVLHDYNTASRPVYNASKKVTVKFGLTLTQISDMVSGSCLALCLLLVVF